MGHEHLENYEGGKEEEEEEEEEGGRGAGDIILTVEEPHNFNPN